VEQTHCSIPGHWKYLVRGSEGGTSYLITSDHGHILIDGGFVETAPQILANIEHLGFRPQEVKILLNSHAHYDHAGGLAELKRLTGACFEAMTQEAPLLQRGGRGDFHFGRQISLSANPTRCPPEGRGEGSVGWLAIRAALGLIKLF
jgi:glyoxylase-like metal-dependent hydrolase (beta-lactamase superfamily II)